MARRKKNRDVSIVHFSFFDVLFGAFGAFVFLMIMQVISSFNMVDIDIRKLVDGLVQERNEMQRELADHGEMARTVIELKESLQSLRDKRAKELKEKEMLARRNRELQASLDALERIAEDAKEMQQRLASLEAEKNRLQRENREMAARLDGLNEELDAYKRIVEEARERGNLQEALKAENERLSRRNEMLVAQNNALSEQVESLGRLQEDARKNETWQEALEREKEELQRSLDEAEQKLAAIKAPPLEVKTSELPATFIGERVDLALAVEGGVPPYTWGLQSGNLPAGLSLDPVSGRVSGEIEENGAFELQVAVADAWGAHATSEPVTLKVVERSDSEGTKVSPAFLVMAIITGLLLLHFFWQKHRARRYFKEMKAKGFDLKWVK